MSVLTAFSDNKSGAAAVMEIKVQLMTIKPKLILYFASSKYDVQEIAKKMLELFPETKVLGCTTAGELISGKMTKGSIVAMAFGSDFLYDVHIQVIPNISTENNVARAFKSFAAYYNTPCLELDPEKYIGIVLFDGLSRAEEKIMDSIGNLTDVTFIGGSAGDDLQFEHTYVFTAGKVYEDAAIVALLKPITPFAFIKTQSFFNTGKVLVATKVNEEQRIVEEFDGRPAVQAYAEAIGCAVSKVGQYFMRHPLGLMVEGEPYVRSPQQTQGSVLQFFCNVKQGMELSVLEATDIISDTKRVLAAKQQELGAIKAIVNFNCILRTLQLEKEGLCGVYGNLFSEIPTIGFSTYGESYIGHINQTATMLVFA